MWPSSATARGPAPRGSTVASGSSSAIFGVRGIGSVYYLAFGAGTAAFSEERWMWSTVTFTIALSVLVHGVLATPVMRRLETHRRATRSAPARAEATDVDG